MAFSNRFTYMQTASLRGERSVFVFVYKKKPENFALSANYDNFAYDYARRATKSTSRIVSFKM